MDNPWGRSAERDNPTSDKDEKCRNDVSKNQQDFPLAAEPLSQNIGTGEQDVQESNPDDLSSLNNTFREISLGPSSGLDAFPAHPSHDVQTHYAASYQPAMHQTYPLYQMSYPPQSFVGHGQLNPYEIPAQNYNHYGEFSRSSQVHIMPAITHFPSQPHNYAHPQGPAIYSTVQQQGSFYHNPVQARGPQMNAIVPQIDTRQSLCGLHRGTVSSVKLILRGPPRKPKQSGHALWIGNLPPGSDILQLRDHFSRQAYHDILSVFLISKSNCAFVNYTTKEGAHAAMIRFHESIFNGVKLVCRLRKAPPIAEKKECDRHLQNTDSQESTANEQSTSKDVERKETNIPSHSLTPRKLVRDKFFVVKSLTVEDLETSIETGTWATQSQNEEILNTAYHSAQNVFLIFSANKSGEYFGYARMASRISEDISTELQTALVQPSKITTGSEQTLTTRTIFVGASDVAPSGFLVDDPGRGTVFWEAGIQESSVVPDTKSERPMTPRASSPMVVTTPVAAAKKSQTTITKTALEPKIWGKPFKIVWLSTTRLPFYHTRGMRNTWNMNREVKIARDGTELETCLGRNLLALFSKKEEAARIQGMFSGY